MQFPNTPETALTEKIMTRVRAKLNPDTHTYNRIYEAVYSALEAEAKAKPSEGEKIIDDFFKQKCGK